MRAPARRAAACALAAVTLAAGAWGCGGDGGDEAATTATDTAGVAPDLTDADQRVVSVLLGFVRLAGEEGTRLAGCADDACRGEVDASLEQAGSEVQAALDAAGEPSECLSGAVDSLRAAAGAAREDGAGALAEIRQDLSEAGRTAAGC